MGADETSGRSKTNRVVQEEQGVVRGPLWPWIAGWGATTIRTEAHHVTMEVSLVTNLQRYKGPEITARLPRENEMGSPMNALIDGSGRRKTHGR